MHGFCHMFVTVVVQLMKVVKNWEPILGWQGGSKFQSFKRLLNNQVRRFHQ
jgi:hypothetical protein